MSGVLALAPDDRFRRVHVGHRRHFWAMTRTAAAVIAVLMLFSIGIAGRLAQRRQALVRLKARMAGSAPANSIFPSPMRAA